MNIKELIDKGDWGVVDEKGTVATKAGWVSLVAGEKHV